MVLRKMRHKVYINKNATGTRYWSITMPTEYAFIFKNSDDILIEKLADNKGLIIRPGKSVPLDD